MSKYITIEERFDIMFGYIMHNVEQQVETAKQLLEYDERERKFVYDLGFKIKRKKFDSVDYELFYITLKSKIKDINEDIFYVLKSKGLVEIINDKFLKNGVIKIEEILTWLNYLIELNKIQETSKTDVNFNFVKHI